MPFGEKGSSDDVEALVDTLTMDGGSLTEANLTTLTTNEIQQLAQLSDELHFPTDMETDESEVVIETVEEEDDDDDEMLQEEEIGAHEVIIETEAERPPSPEEILPDLSPKVALVPPLRPLTIAPKPAGKPVQGQQLLFLQGGSQAIKLVSSQGQELNLANFQFGRPVAIKPAVKTITTQGSIQLVQPKQVVMKKMVAPKAATIGSKQVMLVQKAGQIVQQNQLAPTKTITIQQAQEMGLLTTTKILPQAQSTPKHAVLLNRGGVSKQIKIVPQGAQLLSGGGAKQVLKSPPPTRILPATQAAAAGSRVPQKIIFKNAATGQPILPSAAQLIQVAGTHTINTGQLHQINIPGKGMQYIKFVTATSAETIPSSAISTVKTTMQPSSTNIVLTEMKSGSTIAPKPLKTIAAKTQTSPIISNANHQVVMLPNYLSTKVPIPRGISQSAAPKPPSISPDSSPNVSTETNLDSNGLRPRKACNCTKSQCLKLYCDCFANGEFCYMCNCMNCSNNLENEDHRQRAIRACLERNPNAFRPKIGKAKDLSGDSSIRKHTKGCNCKRSGCLKNYCECYEAKIACSNNCKCVGCRNIEDSMEKKGMRSFDEDGSFLGANSPLDKIGLSLRESGTFRTRRVLNCKHPINYINDDVIEATSQCMLTISHSEESSGQDEVTKGQIIEEFARCLKEIIDATTH